MGLAQVTYNTSSGGGAGLFLYFIVIFAILAIPYWVIFTKAGEDGWKALIPIYSAIIALKIVGRPWWWLLLFFIPFVGFIFVIIFLNDLSKSFGHGVGFTLGLLFLSLIFAYILAFGSSTYRGPSAGQVGGSTPPPPPPMPTA